MERVAMNQAKSFTQQRLLALPMVAGNLAAGHWPDCRGGRATISGRRDRDPRRRDSAGSVADQTGVMHLIYFKGEPAGGDLFYGRSKPGTTEFSEPIRVNSQPGSAVAMGTIRGGQIALGRDGRIHVAWNGSQRAAPPNPIKGRPMLYARLDEQRDAFEPQRNLMQRSFYLDGGGSIGADNDGNVYVAWHATSTDAPQGEAGRRLWVTRSRATMERRSPAKSRRLRVRQGHAAAAAPRPWSIVAARCTSSIAPPKATSSET